MWAEKKTKWICKVKYFNQIVYFRELHFQQLQCIIDEVALSNFLSLSMCSSLRIHTYYVYVVHYFQIGYEVCKYLVGSQMFLNT